MIWTEEKVKQLRCLCKEPLSASEIGARLNITRNAVIGKARRDGINLPFMGMRTTPADSRPPKPRAVCHHPLNENCVEAIRKPSKRAMATVLASVDDKIQPLNIRTARLGLQCQWITNDEVCAPLYCGHPIVTGTNWCAAHYLVVFTPPSDRRRERPKVAARAVA